ncbi:MAG: glutamate synthase subunit beta [Lachnospiraceae bacterium]|jgi:glutamate synthase (NADPH/NADH) small chain|nr:glutamate synthase subunit beta [Lachnospiraceae bacterium]
MGKTTGFLEYDRVDKKAKSEKERIKDFHEFYYPLSDEENRRQGARCMECGVPFCQSASLLAGMFSGCPLHNLVPEWNELIYQDNWKEAFERLFKTNPFPEFTSRVCPALCEKACTCGLNGDPVASKANEYAIIEKAFANGWVKKDENIVRTGKKVAVIGSGPSGLSVAYNLNLRGHSVAVFERSDAIGGLLRYGIPNMKLEKSVIDRRVEIMKEDGIKFYTGVNVPTDISKEELFKQFDVVILACGATKPRDIKASGRESKGIYFAVDFLTEATKSLDDNAKLDGKKYIDAKGKNVIIIGGGDTGNDCAGTSMRMGAKSVIQLEMMPEPPIDRLPSNPWPEWPKVLKTDYGQEEVIDKFGEDPRKYLTTVEKFVSDEKGNLKEVVTVNLKSVKNEKTGRMDLVPVEGSEKTYPCELVLIAAGFLGTEEYMTKGFGVEVNGRTNVLTKEASYKTDVDKIFACGDCHRGQSLVVWALEEGRECAKEVDEYLMGYSNLNV